ncbi:MAG: MFS transporter [Anaerolineaceae bacterium]|nr:MAG: MFS transporter [Anaerolineaceae bacterium]
MGGVMKLSIPPALTHRKYFYLWFGLLISIAGSQMQVAAIHWHIRELTDKPDPLALGGIGLARIVPVIVFSFVGGAVADSYDRRKILFITQTVLAVEALALAALTFSGRVEIWHIYALTALQASASAFDLPARQAMVPNLVSREHLTSAFSMNSIAFNTGAILGPLFFGFIPAGGQGYAYLLDAISFLAVLIALILMGHTPQDLKRAEGVNVRSVWNGMRFIDSHPLIMSTMVMDFIATFFASANTMLPIVARDILNVGKSGYSWLVSAQAIGSVAAGVGVSQARELRRQGPIFIGAVILFGAMTVWFGFSRAFLPALLALTIMGAADAVSTIIRNTIRQLQTPDHIRGRMTSVNQLFFQGGPQLGEVESGVVAALFGVPFAIVSGGIGCIVGLLIVLRRWPQLIAYSGDEPMLIAVPAD